MSQTNKIITAVVITAIVIGGGVYFWQNRQPQQTAQEESSVILTKEYLVSSEWGPEAGPYGMHIKFNADGTFNEQFAGETGDLPVSGSFQIKNNSVTLKVEKYAGKTFEEAQKTHGSNAVYISDRTLTLEKSDSSLYFIDYLANDGRIAYWNRSSKVPEDKERQYESYILITVQKNLKPKINAALKFRPYTTSANYSFNDCDPTCETGSAHKLSEIYKGILARTQFKGTLNGAEDYWYLAQVDVPWYSVAKLNKEIATVSLAWIHGSELE